MFGNALLFLGPIAYLAGHASAHGMVIHPPIRKVGPAYKAACGEQIYNNVASDPYGNIQALKQIGKNQQDYNAASCNLDVNKGFLFADTQAADVQHFTRGQVVPISIDIRAPHLGTASMAIFDTATNKMIGDYLAYWPVFASNAAPIPKNETSFDITIPSTVPKNKCTQPGECTVTWTWDSRQVDQTYVNCIDFTLTG